MTLFSYRSLLLAAVLAVPAIAAEAGSEPAYSGTGINPVPRVVQYFRTDIYKTDKENCRVRLKTTVQLNYGFIKVIFRIRHNQTGHTKIKSFNLDKSTGFDDYEWIDIPNGPGKESGTFTVEVLQPKTSGIASDTYLLDCKTTPGVVAKPGSNSLRLKGGS